MSYEDPRAVGSFGGIQNVKRYDGAKVSKLSKKDAYTLHKATHVRFPRRKTYSKGICDLFQIDLADLTNLSLSVNLHRCVFQASVGSAAENENRTRGDTSFRKDIERTIA